ncbi:DeoR/GlpR family DNA-binding transcription regulator [Gilliamella sp. ESL0250]|uniref:DeoR/GlpR family DNA-binding transcription regulator n=1 Tax=Gilliamella sp. ESL0250 TaxID=2705036 RepID=UPI001580BC8B|nr:DeoR/GlpR family DNA-binding transcription regulator [Gilliamella sp. ESL0250]NUF49187.1 DeoR/GlpR transcriptional regulator [Gilliamella sp. ESL0250]
MARASSALLKRRLQIAEIVRQQGEVKVDELSELLQVSNVTIRQDLTYLEQQGYLKRSFGGAIYIAPESVFNQASTITQSYTQSVSDCRDIELVKVCLSYINDGDTLFLSHGNLIRKLIPFLHSKKSLILIMNDISNAQLAKEFTDAEVIVVGGVLLDGNILQDNKMINFVLNQFSVTHFITELSAINSDNQLIIENLEQVKTYQQIMKKAAHTIGILPQRIAHNDNNSIGILADIDMVVLSRPAVTEYHQQLLDTHFDQLISNKYCVTYQNILET